VKFKGLHNKLLRTTKKSRRMSSSNNLQALTARILWVV